MTSYPQSGHGPAESDIEAQTAANSPHNELDLAKQRLLTFEWRRNDSILRHDLLARHPLALVGGALGAGMLVTGSAAVRGLLWAGLALGVRRELRRAIMRRLRF